MGSQTVPKLPVVDLTKEDLKPGTSSWLGTSNEVLRALEEYGCFVAVYDKLPLKLHNSMLESLEGLFDLPTETKFHNTANEEGVTYYGAASEGFLFENATTLEGTQRFTNVLWPSTGNDAFCETTLLFSKKLEELVEMVMRMVFESYGLDKYYYESQIASSTYHMALAKIQPPKMNEKKGIGSHSDKSILSILDQNHVTSLEIQTKDGRWITFEPSPSHLVVMAGEAFMAWSNGRIHCPSHVHGIITTTPPQENGKEEVSYSATLLSYMKGMVQPPDKLVDDEHPLLFKPFSNLGFLKYWIQEVAKNPKCSLTDYCGV
ncbi:hypothetical protein ACSBR2_023431 [Camellia fascicularis]